MLDLLRTFVSDNVLYYGTLFGLCIIFCVLVCYALWANYRVKLIEQMKEQELEEKRKSLLQAQQEFENEKKELTKEVVQPKKEETVKVPLEEPKHIPSKEESATVLAAEPSSIVTQEPSIEKQIMEKQEEIDESSKFKIEALLNKMQVDLEKEKQGTIDQFEDQQEENSVISYQELKQRVKRNLELDDEQIPLVTTTELLRQTEPILETPKPVMEPVKPISFKEEIKGKMLSELPEDKKEYKRTQFISPIYGIVEDRAVEPIVPKYEPKRRSREEFVPKETVEPTYTNTSLEPKIDIRALEEENRHLDEFLQSLKEFRKNL